MSATGKPVGYVGEIFTSARPAEGSRGYSEICHRGQSQRLPLPLSSKVLASKSAILRQG